MFNNLIDINSILFLLKGTLVTFKIFIGTFLLGTFLGIFLGTISSKAIGFKTLDKIISSLTFIIRSIPSYVLVLFFYFGIPQITRISWPIEIATIFALGLNASCFISQIIKVGINSINRGQWEAAYVLGFNKFKTIKLIIFPQLINFSLPIIVNESIHIIKSTSAISTLGVLEVTKNGMRLVEQGKNPLIIYTLVALISICIIFLARLIKRRLNYDLWK